MGDEFPTPSLQAGHQGKGVCFFWKKREGLRVSGKDGGLERLCLKERAPVFFSDFLKDFAIMRM